MALDKQQIETFGDALFDALSNRTTIEPLTEQAPTIDTPIAPIPKQNWIGPHDHLERMPEKQVPLADILVNQPTVMVYDGQHYGMITRNNWYVQAISALS